MPTKGFVPPFLRSYTKAIPVLVEAFKEQQKQIETLPKLVKK